MDPSTEQLPGAFIELQEARMDGNDGRAREIFGRLFPNGDPDCIGIEEYFRTVDRLYETDKPNHHENFIGILGSFPMGIRDKLIMGTRAKLLARSKRSLPI